MRLKPLPEEKKEPEKPENKADPKQQKPAQQELIQQPKPAPKAKQERIEPPMPTDNPFEDEDNNDFDIF
jgi:hypothetical protein